MPADDNTPQTQPEPKPRGGNAGGVAALEAKLDAAVKSLSAKIDALGSPPQESSIPPTPKDAPRMMEDDALRLLAARVSISDVARLHQFVKERDEAEMWAKSGITPEKHVIVVESFRTSFGGKPVSLKAGQVCEKDLFDTKVVKSPNGGPEIDFIEHYISKGILRAPVAADVLKS